MCGNFDICPFGKYQTECLRELLKQTKDLLANGVIVPPFKVGDTVYYIFEDDEEGWIIDKSRVTEVCSKGYFVSAFNPPGDDLGGFEPYENIGKTVFLTKEEAEKALKEREGK